MAVGQIHPDLDLMTDCVLGRSTENNKHRTLSKRLKDFEGRIPIAYQLKEYAIARHLELRSILLKDEMGYDGTWHDNFNPDST